MSSNSLMLNNLTTNSHHVELQHLTMNVEAYWLCFKSLKKSQGLVAKWSIINAKLACK
jgi:hypothetical protein